jgi:hypothetical protein
MNAFADKDSANLVEMLNFVATHAKFTFDVKDMLKFAKLLNWAQTDLLPKIEAHKVEILSVKEVNPPETVKPAKGKKA